VCHEPPRRTRVVPVAGPAGRLPESWHSTFLRTNRQPTPMRFRACRIDPCVRRKTAYGGGELVTVVPCQGVGLPLWPVLCCICVEDIGNDQQRLRLITVVVTRSCTRAAGVLPLRLGGKTISLSFPFAKPSAHGHGIVPGDIDHRMIVPLVETGVTPRIGWVPPSKASPLLEVRGRRHGYTHTRPCHPQRIRVRNRRLPESLELPNGHLVLPKVERPPDPHLVYGCLVSDGQYTLAFVLRE